MSGIFLRPLWLLAALAALPAFLYVRSRLVRLVSALLPSSEFQAARIRKAILVRSWLNCAAWVCLCVALSGPRWGTELVAERGNGALVIFAIDASRSMLARDCPPNRLAFAARFAQGLIERMDKAAVGVAVFKGEPHLAVPLTQDRRAIAALLENLSPSLMSATGSNPAQAVRLCLDSFPSNQSGARAIVLLTDGDGTAGDLDSAARDCAQRGVTLIVAGVGSDEGDTVDIVERDGSEATYRTRLAESALIQAARSAGGKSLYVSAMERGSAFRALELIQSLAPADGAQSYASRPVDHSWRFVLGAIVLFCLAFAASSTRVTREDPL